MSTNDEKKNEQNITRMTFNYGTDKKKSVDVDKATKPKTTKSQNQ